jgi:transcriptional regulator with XRE-family HTH domain
VSQQFNLAEDGLSPLGERLRARRRQLRLTLKEVALWLGLSVGFISQIERGITSPSLSSLVSVSRVLGRRSPSSLRSQNPKAP